MNTRFKTIVSIIVASFFLITAGGSSDGDFQFYIFLIIAGFIAFFVAVVTSQNKVEEEVKVWKNKQTNDHGQPTLEFHPFDDIKNVVLVFDQKKLLIVNQVTCKYIDIIDFDINNQTSYRSSASTSSVIGRGVVGGVLLGGVGALAGASTGKRNVDASTMYSVNIALRDMANPLLTFTTADKNAAQKLIAVLRNIIDQSIMDEQAAVKELNEE